MYKVLRTNDKPEGTQNQVLDIFLSFEEPLIAPVKARHALYRIEISFSWKELLQVWSYRIFS